MSHWLPWLLLLIFVVHLIAFAGLWVRRRQVYYLALVLTFGLLTLSVGLGISGAAPALFGPPLDQWLRFAAWGAAAVSISWTATRILRRRRQSGRQNSS